MNIIVFNTSSFATAFLLNHFIFYTRATITYIGQSAKIFNLI